MPRKRGRDETLPKVPMLPAATSRKPLCRAGRELKVVA